MAFDGIQITNRGRNLLAKAEAGLTKITYTKFSAGDGKLSGQMPVALKALINEKISFPVSRLKIQNENVVVPGFEFSNKGVTSGFFFREVGLWATDPDLGEILYAYANAGEGAEYIDAQNTSAVLKKLFNFELTVSNTAQVTVVVDDTIIYATPQDVADALKKSKEYTDTQIANVKVPDASLTQKGIVQLSEATNSASNEMAATSKAVSSAISAANQHTDSYAAPKQHSHSASDLPSASTQARGIVQLNTSTSSTATDQAATPSAVKAAYDRADQAFTQAVDLKNKIVRAINGKFGGANPDMSSDQIAAVITKLPVKRFASGTFNGQSAQAPNLSSGAEMNLVLSGLSFTPSSIFVRMDLTDPAGRVYLSGGIRGDTTAKRLELIDGGFNNSIRASTFTQQAGGFTMYVSSGTLRTGGSTNYAVLRAYEWFAYE